MYNLSAIFHSRSKITSSTNELKFDHLSIPLIFSPIVITLNWTNINEHSTLTAFSLKTKSSYECYFVNGAILYIFLILRQND